jgi:hypothetical protein
MGARRSTINQMSTVHVHEEHKLPGGHPIINKQKLLLGYPW